MLVFRFFVFVGLVVVGGRGNKENNVCPTLKDYATIRTNERCWYNPDVNSKPVSVIDFLIINWLMINIP